MSVRSVPSTIHRSTKGSNALRYRLAASRATADSGVEVNIDTLDNMQLLEHMQTVAKTMAYTNLENVLIEKFLEKFDDVLLIGVTKTLLRSKKPTKIHFADEGSTSMDHSYDTKYHKSSSVADDTSLSMHTSRSHKSIQSVRTGMLQESPISYNYKIEMIESECALIIKERDIFEKESKSKIRSITADLDEMKYTIQETADALNGFEEFVIAKGIDPVTGRIPLERFKKYCFMWMKNGNSLVEKMRLKTSTLQQSCNQQKTSLMIKAELSGILRPIDFEQLKIDTRTFSQIVEQKNGHLIGLKRVSGDVSLALAIQRKMLLERENRLNVIQQKIQKIQKESLKFFNESVAVKDECKIWESKIEKLNKEIGIYRAPSANDYVMLKVLVQTYDREIKALKRKKQLEKIKLKNIKSKQKKRSLQDNKNDDINEIFTDK